jgi:hypothetical protein
LRRILGGSPDEAIGNTTEGIMQGSLEEKTKDYWALSTLVRAHKIVNADIISAVEKLRGSVWSDPKLLSRVTQLQHGVEIKVA